MPPDLSRSRGAVVTICSFLCGEYPANDSTPLVSQTQAHRNRQATVGSGSIATFLPGARCGGAVWPPSRRSASARLIGLSAASVGCGVTAKTDGTRDDHTGPGAASRTVAVAVIVFVRLAPEAGSAITQLSRFLDRAARCVPSSVARFQIRRAG
jgi:hypothetical protein